MSPAAESPSPGSAAESLELAALREERNELRRRILEVEQIAEDLAEELGHARARLSALDGSPTTPETASGTPTGPSAPGTGPDHHTARLPLFDQTAAAPDGLVRSVDGSDRLVVPIALAATALVVLLVALLSLANNGLLSLFTIGTFAAAGLLGRAAWATRIVPVEVSVDGGVVLIRRGDASLSFDLTSDALRLEVSGTPGEPDWRVRFYRRGLDPVDVDASMVDAEAFMAQLRRWRPGA